MQRRSKWEEYEIKMVCKWGGDEDEIRWHKEAWEYNGYGLQMGEILS